MNSVKFFMCSLLGSLLLFSPLYAKVTSTDSFFAQGYEAEWVDQTQPENQKSFFTLRPGSITSITVRFKNIGTKTWYRDGEDEVTMATFKDEQAQSAPLWTGFDNTFSKEFGYSYFKSSNWRSDYKVTGLQEEAVKPGETGTFVMTFTAPTDARSGMYREDLSLAAGPYWLRNTKNGDPLHVAHIWVGLVVEGTSTTEQVKMDKEVNQAFLNTINTIKKASFSSTVDVTFIGDLEKLNVIPKEVQSETLKSLVFELVKMGTAGKFDKQTSDLEANLKLNIDFLLNGKNSHNQLDISLLLLGSKEKGYFKITNASLPALDVFADFLLVVPEGDQDRQLLQDFKSFSNTWVEFPLKKNDVKQILSGGFLTSDNENLQSWQYVKQLPNSNNENTSFNKYLISLEQTLPTRFSENPLSASNFVAPFLFIGVSKESITPSPSVTTDLQLPENKVGNEDQSQHGTPFKQLSKTITINPTNKTISKETTDMVMSIADHTYLSLMATDEYAEVNEALTFSAPDNFVTMDSICSTSTVPPFFCPREYVDHEIIVSGDQSGITTKNEMIITSEEEWKALWQKLDHSEHPEIKSLPKVNFDKESIVALFQGQKPTSGYMVDAMVQQIGQDRFEISVSEGGPGEGCVVAQVITTPYLIIKTKKLTPANTRITRATTSIKSSCIEEKVNI